MPDKIELLSTRGRFLLAGAPEGYDAVVLAERLAEVGGQRSHLHIARDAGRMDALAVALRFFAPDIDMLLFPAWDCLPYDRVSPNREVVAQRIATLAALAAPRPPQARPLVVITSVNAILQRLPVRETIDGSVMRLQTGTQVARDDLHGFFSRNGFERTGTVREPGEFAVRGGIVDLFPPGADVPLRLDFFGDELQAIRAFDAHSQRTTGAALDGFDLRPASEVLLDPEAIQRFRTGYRDRFGNVADDPLYAAVSEGRRQIGMEHWLPLFHERLETLFDYLPDASITLDHETEQLRDSRLETITEYFDARMTYLESRTSRVMAETALYRPLRPELLHLDAAEFERMLADRMVGQFSPLNAPEGVAMSLYTASVACGGRRVPDFSLARADGPQAAPDTDAERLGPHGMLAAYAKREIREGRRLVIAGLSQGSCERLGQLLENCGIGGLCRVDSWSEATALPAAAVALTVLPVEHGFRGDGLSLLTEQDVLGERIVRTDRKRARAEQFIADVSEISEGDLVVHIEHGIGCYGGLETLDVAGAPHDCLRITYAGDTKLYLPVENIDVLSRYGSGDATMPLDRLGSQAWQARKARMKDRLREIAGELIAIAAERTVKAAPVFDAGVEMTRQFAAGFAYDETEDQVEAIENALGDLRSGKPMDRVICGDVGFGKTEVALRAAFATAMSGAQVAVIAPTTLLCRQHFATFSKRFEGTAISVAQLSRLVAGPEAREIRGSLANGRIDVVIGTHALLGDSVRFRNLGLIVVDEEQRFGVKQKEALKRLKTNVHVLTLSATPIPRTLQMALTGVRDMSVIGTPPVDRLAVRTFVAPYDPVMIREAIMREHFRGGQTFYVCPRISDLKEVAAELKELVPEIDVAIAHGRMPSDQLEEVMSSFYDQSVNLLLSTQIVESGLDIPTANTMIVHRADMYGLAQLYQLRGRIGRSRLRAYCYMLLPAKRRLTAAALKRLEAMQALDTLGAGFRLASHDLDIRGAGNLLGDQQSGHIREIGVELYQHMLEEAVATARGGGDFTDRDWSPTINLGIPVLIPDHYVADLDVRLGLYRRMAGIADARDQEGFAAELIDRFGALPAEVENLLQVVAVKRACRRAGIERLDAGPKGATIAFHGNTVANLQGLLGFVSDAKGRCRIRPDNTLVYRADWARPQDRLGGVLDLAAELAAIAAESSPPEMLAEA